jgi:UDP-N-acetylmuramoyl-tripeptide--D-alanyl-D-alanine ligase
VIVQLDLQQAQRWIPGAVGHFPAGASAVVNGVCTDTRAITPGCMFVALRGDRFDGHTFADAAIAAGASAVMLETASAVGAAARPVAQIQVPDTTLALGALAAGWRAQFDLPVIAVTGSNGKTTVKGMIAAILEAAFGPARYHATPGNLNNQIGVPLTLLGLSAEHRAAVVELGMNHPGEIAGLAHMTGACVALVNNAQREHQEFLDGVEATALENGAAITELGPDGVAVFPADDAFAPLWRSLAGSRSVIQFALGDDGQAVVSASEDADSAGFELRLRGLDVNLTVRLAIDGQHNVRNALAAAACCRAIGVPSAAIVEGLERFRPLPGRLVRHARAGAATVIDDSYNANPDSVRAAIDLLAGLRQRGAAERVVLVLGDMGEVGANGPEFHAEVGAWARQQGLDTLIATGTLARAAVQGWTSTTGTQDLQTALHCESIDEAIAAARIAATPGTTLLVKGSRFMRMERVVHGLLDADVAHPVGGHA